MQYKVYWLIDGMPLERQLELLGRKLGSNQQDQVEIVHRHDRPNTLFELIKFEKLEGVDSKDLIVLGDDVSSRAISEYGQATALNGEIGPQILQLATMPVEVLV